MIREITFQGQQWLLIGDTEGPIATPEAYRTGRVSYAHLCSDGTILRYGESIGTRDDIVFGKNVAAPVDLCEETFDKLFDPDEWSPLGPKAGGLLP